MEEVWHFLVKPSVVATEVVNVLGNHSFEILWHDFFHILRGVVAVDAVAITDAEEVEAKVAHHVWNQNVGVLVLLVRIARLVANARCKRKLGDAVEPFSCLNRRQVLKRLHDLLLWLGSLLLLWLFSFLFSHRIWLGLLSIVGRLFRRINMDDIVHSVFLIRFG